MADALRNPLYRSGYALVINTAGTTIVGVFYWVVAAHLYSQQVVGQASAMVSGLILVSSFAQLNLGNTLPRFLPETGRRAGRLIGYGYGVSALAALAVSLGFVAILPRVNAQWRFLGSSVPLSLAFVAAAVVWVLFALQDAALVGLRRPVMVPLENTVYGVAKLAMLLAIAALLPATGIFASWVIPLVVIVPAVNWLIFRRYLPGRESAADVATVLPSKILRFTSIDYVGNLLGQAYGNLPPLLVLSVLGAAANGSFYIAWTISTGLELIAANFATSLLVEGASAPARLAELTRGVLARCLLVTVPGAAVMALAARPILSIYGHGYAVHATRLLGLLAAGSALYGLLALAISLDRIADRVGRATLTRLVVAILVLGGSWLLLPRLGVDAVGVAWLGANVIAALVRLPTIVAAAWPRAATRAGISAGADSLALPAGPPARTARQDRPPGPPHPDRPTRPDRPRRPGQHRHPRGAGRHRATHPG